MQQHLRIAFPKPGFFLTDARLTIWLDHGVVYDGSFTSGVDVVVPIAPGHHALATQIEMGPIARRKEYAVDVPGGAHETSVLLAYSRLWGNMKGKPTVTHR
jgi:hypothetical protein